MYMCLLNEACSLVGVAVGLMHRYIDQTATFTEGKSVESL